MYIRGGWELRVTSVAMSLHSEQQQQQQQEQLDYGDEYEERALCSFLFANRDYLKSAILVPAYTIFIKLRRDSFGDYAFDSIEVSYQRLAFRDGADNPVIKLPNGHLYSWQGLGDFWEFLEKARSRLAEQKRKKNAKNLTLELLADAVDEAGAAAGAATSEERENLPDVVTSCSSEVHSF